MSQHSSAALRTQSNEMPKGRLKRFNKNLSAPNKVLKNLLMGVGGALVPVAEELPNNLSLIRTTTASGNRKVLK